MKKVLSAIVILAMLFTLATTNVFAADAAIVGELKGSHIVDGTKTWDGGVVMEADGDSLIMGPSGDAYGFVFEGLEAGVYKIGYYLTVDSFAAGKQIRVSPKVTKAGAEEHRCWLDFPVDEVTLEFGEEEGKILVVAIINVPEGFDKIDVGAWQDADAYVGKLDKVVLATGDYSFDEEGEYTLVAEKALTAVFTEDAGGLLVPEEGSWVDSFDTDPTPVTPSEPSGPSEPQDPETPVDGDKTQAPQTADVSVMLAVVAAGAAAFGGLKLRKK